MKSLDNLVGHLLCHTYKVYGTVEMQKEDCVNHVSKRMGTALRKLSAESKSQGSSISGRGKLTQLKLTKIQNYYG